MATKVELKDLTLTELQDIKQALFTLKANFYTRRKADPQGSAFLCCIIQRLVKDNLISELSSKYLQYEIELEVGGSKIQTLGSVAYKLNKNPYKFRESTDEYVTKGNKYRVTFMNRLIRRVRKAIADKE